LRIFGRKGNARKQCKLLPGVFEGDDDSRQNLPTRAAVTGATSADVTCGR
jgi:hypothetical protein